MKKLMIEGSQLRGNDIDAGILWRPDDAFAQVLGAKRGGHVRRVGFGPTLSGNCVRSMDDSTPHPTSTATDQKVIELTSQVEEMKEKCAHYDVEMKEKCAHYDAEMRSMRRMMTSLFTSFHSLSTVRRFNTKYVHFCSCLYGDW